MYRGMKNGIDPRDIKAELTELRQQSENGQDFKAALESHGYELVTGRRGLLILDPAGKEHSLAKRCGMPMKEVLAFMHDVNLEACQPWNRQRRSIGNARKPNSKTNCPGLKTRSNN